MIRSWRRRRGGWCRIRDGRIVEERRDGNASLVVGRDGWIRLPGPLLDDAGIDGRARAEVTDDGLLLSASDRGDAGAGTPTSRRPAPLAFDGQAVRLELDRVSRARGRGRARRPVIDDVT